MYTLGFCCGEDKPILQSPARQTIEGDLEAMFYRNHATGTEILCKAIITQGYCD
jgi:hypothetical protein